MIRRQLVVSVLVIGLLLTSVPTLALAQSSDSQFPNGIPGADDRLPAGFDADGIYTATGSESGSGDADSSCSLSTFVRKYDGDGDCAISLRELGKASVDFANGDISLSKLGSVSKAFANTDDGDEAETNVTSYSVTVTDVTDGDTIDIQFANGSRDTVRLLGIDTPEVFSSVTPAEFDGVPDTPSGRAWLRDWGENASRFVERTVEGKSVTVRFDTSADRRGSFGRLLMYVDLNSTYTLNYDLVQDGYARVFTGSFSEESQYLAAEAAAQANDTGVWGFTPRTGSGDGSLAIVTIHEDARGDEYDNLNDEYVTFENTGSTTLDLSGWTVRDEAVHTYMFPRGFTLAPGAEVTLHTGAGSDTNTDLYWGEAAPVWNNAGDTVIVKNATGENVTVQTYD